jgi:hypothetical protein
MYLHRSLNNPFNHTCELALNRIQMRLDLPAMEVGTVVGDFETEVAGHGDSKKTTDAVYRAAIKKQTTETQS